MANVNNILNKVLENESLAGLIVVPAGIDWTEELYRIVELVSIKALEELDLSNLTIDNILSVVKQITEDDIKIITESDLIISNINRILDHVLKQSKLGELIVIPAGTDWTRELYRVVELLNVPAFQENGKFSLAQFTSLESILRAVSEIKDENVEIITESDLIIRNINSNLRTANENSE